VLHRLEVVAHVILGCAKVLPLVYPVQGVRKERTRSIGRFGEPPGSAQYLPRCRSEPGSGFSAASRCLRLRLGGGAGQLQCDLVEFLPEPFGEAGKFLQMRGTLVLAVGFPIPSAPIGLVYLDLGLAAVQPPARFPAAGTAGPYRLCTSRNQSRCQLPPRVDFGLFLPAVSAPV